MFIGLGVALVLVMVFAAVWYRGGGPAQWAGLSGYEGARLDGPAPEFRLTDQNGAAVSLSDFRGKVVVLSVLDPECTDVCPIYA